MYKALIVDDDYVVRTDLRLLLDWEQLGVELLEDAVNGKDALVKINGFQPDILITDLGMPIMDGIELLKELKQQGFCGGIIVLSCHDDFKYVREAMKLGAYDYLIKHSMEEQEMKSAILKLIEKLENENKLKCELQTLKSLKEITKPDIIGRFIANLVSGNISQKELKDQISNYEINIYIDKIIIGIIDTAALNITDRTFIGLVDEILDGVAGGICGAMKEGCLCILLTYPSYKGLFVCNSEAYAVLDKIMNSIKTKTGIDVTIGISHVCCEPEGAGSCFNQARYAVRGKFYQGKGRLIHYSEVENYVCNHSIDLIKAENDIRNYLTKVSDDIETVIGNMSKRLRRENISVESAISWAEGIVFIIKRLQSVFFISAEEIFGEEIVPYNQIVKRETLDEICEWLVDMCKRMRELLSMKASKKTYRTEIAKSIEYIEENYMNDITLDSTCTHIGLSRTYFSQLFKRETGTNFVDYLAEYRLEKAKRLLENTDNKIYDISSMVGINNYRYFTMVFKKATGFTPVEYRNLRNA